MKKRIHPILDIFFRYFFLILFGIFSNKIFYFIFSSLTIYPVYFLLNLFFDASLKYNVILINYSPIEIIGPCIAGSAYYLLLILNLSTKGIELKKRAWLFILTSLSFLMVNILRIFVLSILFINGFSLFDMAHKLFWYLGSIIFVVGIWFFWVKVLKIKEVPFYSDIKFLSKDLIKEKAKKSKRAKKH